MPYNPGNSDRSGEILSAHVVHAADRLGEAFKLMGQRKREDAKEAQRAKEEATRARDLREGLTKTALGLGALKPGEPEAMSLAEIGGVIKAHEKRAGIEFDQLRLDAAKKDVNDIKFGNELLEMFAQHPTDYQHIERTMTRRGFSPPVLERMLQAGQAIAADRGSGGVSAQPIPGLDNYMAAVDKRTGRVLNVLPKPAGGQESRLGTGDFNRISSRIGELEKQSAELPVDGTTAEDIEKNPAANVVDPSVRNRSKVIQAEIARLKRMLPENQGTAAQREERAKSPAPDVPPTEFDKATGAKDSPVPMDWVTDKAKRDSILKRLPSGAYVILNGKVLRKK
jgi:hypothetical protein